MILRKRIVQVVLVALVLGAIGLPAAAQASYSISGVVFEDLDRDGTLDAGEATLTGVMVRIDKDHDCDGVIDELGSVSSDGSTGVFAFTGLPQGGCYSLHADYYDNWVQTAPVTVQSLAADMTEVNIGAVLMELAFTPTTLPNGLLGQAYNQTVTISGGVAPYTFEPGPDMNLPSGVTYTFDPAGKITISGTPTVAGRFLFDSTIGWTDGQEFHNYYQRAFLVMATDEHFTWTPTSPAPGETVTFTAPAGFARYLWGARLVEGVIAPGGEDCTDPVGEGQTLQLTFPTAGDYVICVFAGDESQGLPTYSDRQWVTVAKPPALPALHVGSIVVTAKVGKRDTTASATVQILDQAGKPVSKAVVSGQWSLPNGTTLSQEATTNASGVATFRNAKDGAGTYRLCVTAVAKKGYVYQESANVETCDAQ